MKYLCIGYFEGKKWDAMSNGERDAFIIECLAYKEALRKNGRLTGGETLQSVRTAITLRFQTGKGSAAGGPCTETKKQPGGFMVLEATDLKRAIHLMSKHPGIRLGGCFELHSAEDIDSQ